MLAWILTLVRLPLAAAFALVLGVYTYSHQPLTIAQIIALLALALAAEITDAIDGWIARRSGSQSELGGLVDPLSDSLARLTMYFALALRGWAWIAVPLVMAGRDLIVAYVRVVVGSIGGKTSARISGKVKAIVQGAGIVALVLLAGAPTNAGTLEYSHVHMYRQIVAAVVLVITIWSLVDYVRAGWPAVVQMARRPSSR